MYLLIWVAHCSACSVTYCVRTFLTLWAAAHQAQTVKNLPARREALVWPLDGEDPLEKGMATHSSILSGESHGVRSPAGYSPWDCRVGHDWATDKHRFELDLLDVYKYGVIKHIFLKVNCHTIMQAEINIRTMIWVLRKKDSGKRKRARCLK